MGHQFCHRMLVTCDPHVAIISDITMSATKKKHVFFTFLLLQCQSNLKFCNKLDFTTQARLVYTQLLLQLFPNCHKTLSVVIDFLPV